MSLLNRFDLSRTYSFNISHWVVIVNFNTNPSYSPPPLLPSPAVLKTGASGMIAYRLQTRDGSWQWLQTSSRLVYKNSKPDFIICTHRPLMWVLGYCTMYLHKQFAGNLTSNISIFRESNWNAMPSWFSSKPE